MLEVFGDPRAIFAGAFFPLRTAVAVDGGYRVTGRTTFITSRLSPRLKSCSRASATRTTTSDRTAA
jgi:hypothetical protein